MGRGCWERESEPVDDPTLLDDSEPGEGSNEKVFTYRQRDTMLIMLNGWGGGACSGVGGYGVMESGSQAKPLFRRMDPSAA